VCRGLLRQKLAVRELNVSQQNYRNGVIETEMGFLFYANFVRFVLEGGYGHVLAERARVWMKAAGIVPPGE
jgi:hypothetical protein